MHIQKTRTHLDSLQRLENKHPSMSHEASTQARSKAKTNEKPRLLGGMTLTCQTHSVSLC